MKKNIALYMLYVAICICMCSCFTEKSGTNEAPSVSRPPGLSQREIENIEPLPVDRFSVYTAGLIPGPVIPGLFEGAVPQGLAYYADADLMMISNYMFDGRASNITLFSMSGEAPVKTLWLMNGSGSPHTGHVGGLAAAGKRLWVASENKFYAIPLDDVLAASDGARIAFREEYEPLVKCSFAASAGGVLYIGEFTSADGSYTTPESHHYRTSGTALNHALMAGFILDEERWDTGESDDIDGGQDYDSGHMSGDNVHPDFLLSLPDEVQGAVFTDELIILSLSYGRRNTSRLASYRSPLRDEPDRSFTLPDGNTVPVYVLDKTDLVRSVNAPPMSEGITAYRDKIAVLYESGSDKYRSSALLPQDHIHLLERELFRPK